MIYTKPRVVHVKQTDTNICWAASVMMAMVVKRDNPKTTADWTPKNIVDRIYHGYSNKPSDDILIKAALEAYGATNVVIKKGAATWGEIIASISANRPLLIGISWASYGGHAAVIGGYEMDQSNIPWVALNDPLKDNEAKISYDRLIKGNYDTDGHRGEGNKWSITASFQ